MSLLLSLNAKENGDFRKCYLWSVLTDFRGRISGLVASQTLQVQVPMC